MTCAGFHVEENAQRRSNTNSFGLHCGYCGARCSNWDNGCLLVPYTGSGHDDKFVLRFCAPRQGALANTVQALALSHIPHLADRDGCVVPGVSDTSIRNLAESWSEVSNRIGKDLKLRWSDVVDTANGKNIVFTTMRQPFVGRCFLVHLRHEKGPWSAARS